MSRLKSIAYWADWVADSHAQTPKASHLKSNIKRAMPLTYRVQSVSASTTPLLVFLTRTPMFEAKLSTGRYGLEYSSTHAKAKRLSPWRVGQRVHRQRLSFGGLSQGGLQSSRHRLAHAGERSESRPTPRPPESVRLLRATPGRSDD